MKSKPATPERIKEMVELGLLTEVTFSKEFWDEKAHEIQTEVDDEFIKQCNEAIGVRSDNGSTLVSHTSSSGSIPDESTRDKAL